MGGNVWEWVADKYDAGGERRVVRGGSCCSFFVGPRAPNRNGWAPGSSRRRPGVPLRGAEMRARCVLALCRWSARRARAPAVAAPGLVKCGEPASRQADARTNEVAPEPPPDDRDHDRIIRMQQSLREILHESVLRRTRVGHARDRGPDRAGVLRHARAGADGPGLEPEGAGDDDRADAAGRRVALPDRADRPRAGSGRRRRRRRLLARQRRSDRDRRRSGRHGGRAGPARRPQHRGRRRRRPAPAGRRRAGDRRGRRGRHAPRRRTTRTRRRRCPSCRRGRRWSSTTVSSGSRCGRGPRSARAPTCRPPGRFVVRHSRPGADQAARPAARQRPPVRDRRAHPGRRRRSGHRGAARAGAAPARAPAGDLRGGAAAGGAGRGAGSRCATTRAWRRRRRPGPGHVTPLLALHESAPLGVLLRKINKDSENDYAERVLEAAGAEVFGGPADRGQGCAAAA